LAAHSESHSLGRDFRCRTRFRYYTADRALSRRVHIRSSGSYTVALTPKLVRRAMRAHRPRLCACVHRRTWDALPSRTSNAVFVLPLCCPSTRWDVSKAYTSLHAWFVSCQSRRPFQSTQNEATSAVVEWGHRDTPSPTHPSYLAHPPASTRYRLGSYRLLLELLL
jgi:hypothetical protein